MPDYIYMLESRLSPEQTAVLNRVQQEAQDAGLNVYLVGGAVETVPVVNINERGGNFDKEEDRLDGPAPEEGMDEGGGGLRAHQPDGKPDAHARNSAKDQRQQDKELRVAFDEAEQGVVMGLVGAAFGQDQEGAAADGEVADKDVQHGYQGDDEAVGKICLPDRIVQASTLSTVARTFA